MPWVGVVFFSSPLRQEVIRSVQQAFCWECFLISVSHALARSREAAAVSWECTIFPCSVCDHLQRNPLSVFLLFGFFFFKAEDRQQQHHRWESNKLLHNVGSHPLLPQPQRCVSMDRLCVSGFCGFHCQQVGLWWQQPTNTTKAQSSAEKITLRWPVIANRRLLPVPLLLCYRRG